MTSIMMGLLTVIVLYMMMMIVIGFKFSKKNKSTGDFYLGGRKLGPFVTAMSAEASDMSSWLLMGLPGVALATGIADAGWTAIGLAIGTYFNWLIVAKKLRRYSARIDAITLPDFFAKRFGTSKAIVGIAALFIVVFFVPYTASGFAACGKLFGTVFGIDYFTAMLISAVVIVGYTALGGFNAASTTDFIQSIVMTIALVIVLGFGVTQAGGMDAVMDNASKLPGYLSMFNTYSAEANATSPYSALTIASTLAWGLGYFGMPHVLLRFMAIDDENKLGVSRRVATVWVVISMAVAVFIGVIGNAMIANGAIASLSDPETIIVETARLLSNHGVIAIIAAGIILSGILASTMSTADSQLLAASSSVSENIVKDVFGIKLSDKVSMLVARVTVLVIAVVAVVLASDPNSSVFNIVSFAWAGFGAVFGPAMLTALFWKRVNKIGTLCGMIVGGVMVFVWEYCISPIGGIWGIYELLPAFVAGLAVNVVVSLCTKAPSKEITDIFEEVKSK